ncbi:hypothetical protein CP8484711_1352A, partial [Chlamydia psittaci 84-8471/1]
MKIIKFGTQLK